MIKSLAVGSLTTIGCLFLTTMFSWGFWGFIGSIAMGIYVAIKV